MIRLALRCVFETFCKWFQMGLGPRSSADGGHSQKLPLSAVTSNDVHRPLCTVRPALGDVQRALCTVRPALMEVQRALCTVRPAPLDLQRASARSGLVTYNHPFGITFVA